MQRIRDFLVVLLIGFVLGASVGIGIYTRTIISEREQHELIVADWERQLAERDRELAEARKLAEQRRAIDAEIMESVEQGLGAIRAARSEYERTIAQFRLAQSVYETLRKYYDPGYKGQKNVNN